MARSIKRTNIDVAGLSVQDIMNIDWTTLSKLSDRSLANITSRLVSAANKRIKRLRSKGDINSPALRSLEDAGINKFSVKGKDYNSLKTTISDVKTFMNMKTSSLRGVSHTKKEMQERVMDEFNIDEESYQAFDWNQFWEVWNKMKETNQPLFNSMGSNQVKELLYEQMTVKQPAHHTTQYRLKKLSEALEVNKRMFEDKRKAEIERIKNTRDKFSDVY